MTPFVHKTCWFFWITLLCFYGILSLLVCNRTSLQQVYFVRIRILFKIFGNGFVHLLNEIRFPNWNLKTVCQNINWEDESFELPFDWFSTILRYLSNLLLISLQFENIALSHSLQLWNKFFWISHYFLYNCWIWFDIFKH